MSGKRSLKKQQKRQASALAQLEELYRRGADDEFLARAAEQVGDLAASPFAAKWAEVADRALRQSLARSDLGRLDRLLRSLRRCGPPRPLAILAEGVLDLAAGRLDAARSRLSGLAAEAFPPGLLAELQALARDEADGSQKDDPYLRAAADLLAALQSLDVEALARRLQTLRSLAPAELLEDVDLRRLLDGAERCLSLLSALAALLEGDEVPASPEITAWIRGRWGPLLAAALSASGPPLLAPLHHAVQTRWRTVLERVAAREGSPGLEALWTADPKLLAHHVDLPGGMQRGQEGLRQRAQAQQLLAAERYEELAHLLRSRSRTASEPGDLAASWSLELWARSRWTPDEPEAEDDEEPDLSEPFPHRTLVRLGEMALEIGRRFPAGQRAEVARVLCGDLFDLCEEVALCDHLAGAALALLEHQPGDAGLLIAGVVGAIAGGDSRALRKLKACVDCSGTVNTEDRAITDRLMARAARVRPRILVRILDTVRPLFSGDAWPEITELVGREMGVSVALTLSMTSLAASMDPEGIRLALGEIRGELDLLRPALGGTPGFAAVELILDCWRLDQPAVEKRLARLLDGFPGYEGILSALQVLRKALSPWSPQGIEVAAGGLAQAAIDRLDDRWQLWCHAVPMLAVNADDAPLQRLEKKVRRLLASPEIQKEGRETLEKCLQRIHDVKKRRRELDRPRRPQRKKKPGRRRPGEPQLPLHFP